MANSTPQQNKLLSCLLDDVIGTEEIVQTRQDFCKIRDCILSSNPLKIRQYHTGSKAEGLDLAGSDVDFMYDINNRSDIDVSESMQVLFQSSRTHKFVMISDDVPPGFVLLKCISQIHDQHLIRSLVKVGDDMYLRSQLFMHSSPDLQPDGDTRTIQGPSVEVNLGIMLNDPGFDNVPSIHCKSWPTSSVEWIDRPRHYGWPSQQDIKNIVSFGCHLVPKGHPLSLMKSLEWRLSFSVAERMLVWSFNHTQMQCYALMKIILKEYVKAKCSKENKGVLCSYFIKTFLFWKFEETDPLFWKTQNFQGCLIYLLREFYKCLQKGVIRYYFIPRFNLLEIKLSHGAQAELLQLFAIIIQQEVGIFEHCASLSGVLLKFRRDQQKPLFQIPEIYRQYVYDNEHAIMCTLFKLRVILRFAQRHSLCLEKVLVGLENLVLKGATKSSLPLMVVNDICAEISVRQLRSVLKGNKSQYNH